MLEMFWGVVSPLLRWLVLLVLAGACAGGLSKKLDPEDRIGARRIFRAGSIVLIGVTAKLYQRTLGAQVARYRRWGRQRAALHVEWARRQFGPDAHRLFHPRRLIRESVGAWYTSMPLAAAAYVVKAYILLMLTLNLGTIVTSLVEGTARVWKDSQKAPIAWWAPGGGMYGPTWHSAGTGGKGLDLLTAVASWRALGSWAWEKAARFLAALANPAARPAEAATAAATVTLAVAFLLAVRAAWGLIGFRRGHPRDNGIDEHISNVRVGRWPLLHGLLSLRVGAARRNRPVVVLVNCLATVGAARHDYRLAKTSHNVLVAPRVHLAAAERMVWSAWRTRHPAARGPLRREYRKHAAKVVGALRQMEARQDTEADTGKVFDDMAHLLTKIAERYASGRTLALLDPEDLNEAEEAVNREWVRMLVFGAVMAATAVGVGLAAFSPAVSTQIFAVVGAIAWVLLYRDRLGPGEVLEVMRGQSRK
ncbi:hypothetical protein [Streptomyces noursei]|uniref:hypothetical protein n=1 Tax=Streptomyces noursei TaxID=1971 RepID=UPI00381516C5